MYFIKPAYFLSIPAHHAHVNKHSGIILFFLIIFDIFLKDIIANAFCLFLSRKFVTTNLQANRYLAISCLWHSQLNLFVCQVTEPVYNSPQIKIAPGLAEGSIYGHHPIIPVTPHKVICRLRKKIRHLSFSKGSIFCRHFRQALFLECCLFFPFVCMIFYLLFLEFYLLIFAIRYGGLCS